MTGSLLESGETRNLSVQPADDAPMRRFAWWLTLLAGLCGLTLIVLAQWSIVSPQRRTVSFEGSRRLILIGWLVLMASCSAIPQFQRLLLGLIRRLRQTTVVARRRTTILIFILATSYLLLTARLQHRDFNLNIQDEMMYVVQAQLLARGHLFLPAHPMADFFQELFIFNTPVYASMYFPGTSLLYALAILLHIPNWLLAAGVSGAAVALLYRVFAELLDGAAGVLGALLLIACSSFRWASVMVMSHPLAMLQGLLMFWCFLRWRRARGGWRWMTLFGVLAGWAAITRPLDAIALTLPPLACIAIELYRRGRVPQIGAVLLIAGAGMPFIALQLFFDKGVTGHWLQTPVQAYHHRYFPATFEHGESPAKPSDLPPQLPQFQSYYEQFILPASTHYREEQLLARFPYAIVRTLPTTWLLFFIPLGVVALTQRTHLAVAAVFVLFVLLYMSFMYFLPHYLIVVIPTGLFLVLLGARQLERWTARRARNYVSCLLALILLGSAIAGLPSVNGMHDEARTSTILQSFNHQAIRMERPAVVFFHSIAGDPNAWRHEQVYNIDAAWPDDSPIVRVQDLGERDIELVQYYAQRQPDRIFYQYQQEARQLVRLGTAAELLKDPKRLHPPEMSPDSAPHKSPHDKAATRRAENGAASPETTVEPRPRRTKSPKK